MKILEFGMHYIRRLAIKNKTPFEEYLMDCTPYRAKQHIIEMDSMFARLNEYVSKEQQVRISLKVPKK